MSFSFMRLICWSLFNSIIIVHYTHLQLFKIYLACCLKYNKYGFYRLQNIRILSIYSMRTHRNIAFIKTCKLLL